MPAAYGAGTYVQDTCYALPQADVCDRVRDRRAGVSAYYRFEESALDAAQRALWMSISSGSDEPRTFRKSSGMALAAEISGPHVPDVVFRDAAGGRFDAIGVALWLVAVIGTTTFPPPDRP